MNVKVWVWCLNCQRAFSVLLNEHPRQDDGTWIGAFEFFTELEMQLGVEKDGQVYAECPYDECDASPHNFWWWDEYRRNIPDSPEVPELDKEYSLYPES